MHGPPEVGNLQASINAKKQILELDVAVDDVLPMAVVQRVRELRHIFRRTPLVEPTPTAVVQLMEQFATARVLQDEVDAGVVVEVAEQTQDVGMPQMALYLDFAP